jgi:uncharacterized small protein (DUF1192 family)
VKAAIERGVQDWGSHNGSSRAFFSVKPNVVAEERIAAFEAEVDMRLDAKLGAAERSISAADRD